MTLPEPYYRDTHATLYRGEAITILAQLRDLGAIVTDPPYSSGGQFRGDRMASTSTKYVHTGVKTVRPEFSGDNRDQRSFLLWSTIWLNTARDACLTGSPIVCFSDWRQLPTVTDAIQAGGWTWRGIAIWNKGFGRPGPGRFSSSAEFLVWGSSGPMPPRNIYPPGTFTCPSLSGKQKDHIAQKPLPVMHWALQIVDPSRIVCDPFAGSGSTLVAAKAQGIRSIGIESDEHSLAVAARRLASIQPPTDPPPPIDTTDQPPTPSDKADHVAAV
jgi:site-specific DNA-methyltransferase (adenine-specific)